jgi:hypothetical protein
MADQNSSDGGKAGQVHREVTEALQRIIDGSRHEAIQCFGTLHSLGDLLPRVMQFDADFEPKEIRSHAMHLQALGTRAMYAAVQAIAMSERVNVCAQALEVISQ